MYDGVGTASSESIHGPDNQDESTDAVSVSPRPEYVTLHEAINEVEAKRALSPLSQQELDELPTFANQRGRSFLSKSLQRSLSPTASSLDPAQQQNLLTRMSLGSHTAISAGETPGLARAPIGSQMQLLGLTKLEEEFANQPKPKSRLGQQRLLERNLRSIASSPTFQKVPSYRLDLTYVNAQLHSLQLLDS